MVLTESDYNTLKIGDSAIDFDLKGTDGKNYSLESFSDKAALLIIFMCNHCPYVKPKLDLIKELQDKYGERGLQVIGINANDPKKYPEDNFENMKEVAEHQKFNFIYLYDSTQEIAKKYGAKCTPDPYLFNAKRKLVYHGQLDDAPGQDPSNAKSKPMEEAIKELLETGKVTKENKPSIGCSIKWK